MVTSPRDPGSSGAHLPLPWTGTAQPAAGAGLPFGIGAAGGDAVRPSFFGVSSGALAPFGSLAGGATEATSLFAILGSVFAAAQNWINTLASRLMPPGAAFSAPVPAAPAFAPTQTLQDGHLESSGDPHLSVTGTDALGNAVDAHFDSMVSHDDLIDTNDFGDGLRVATRVTQPQGQNGVTTNASATATMNGGNDAVTLTKDGRLAVRSNGRTIALAPGDGAVLSGGERVTRNADGSVSIAQSDGAGKTMQTTFRANGSGVDVTSDVHGGVTLGGDLVNGGRTTVV